MTTTIEPRREPSRSRSAPRPTRANAADLPAPTPAFETIASTAARLGVNATTLRALCRRKGERVGDCIVALLDDGVVAFKFGPRWRVRFKQS